MRAKKTPAELDREYSILLQISQYIRDRCPLIEPGNYYQYEHIGSLLEHALRLEDKIEQERKEAKST